MATMPDGTCNAARHPRARDCGIVIGSRTPGEHNAITDVPGVAVGHSTIIRGDGALVPGRGPVRTGVTAVLPHPGDLFREKVAGVVHRINGFGEVTNAEQVREMGVLEGPLLLTNTLNVPRVADYAIDWALERYPEMGVSDWNLSPIVAETNDQYLNDIRGRHVAREHVLAAIEGARSGPVEEGSVGGGTGMSCLGFKGGIGTASRLVDVGSVSAVDNTGTGRWTIGVLVQTNFGHRGELRVDGVPVGRELLGWLDEADRRHQQTDPGVTSKSIIIVVATDAPLTVRQLRRLAVRSSHGLARTGSMGSSTSGDFVIAFSTANRVAHQPAAPTYTWTSVAETSLRDDPSPPPINHLFEAVIEATEEAVLNAIFRADTMIGRDWHVRHGLPIEETLAILHRYGVGG
jgi:D-aminopeptidase